MKNDFLLTNLLTNFKSSQSSLNNPINVSHCLMNSPLRFKICVIGSAGTGKSSIINKLINNTFSESTEATVGVDFHTLKMAIDNETTINLDIWDSAGQERYKSVAKGYFRDAHGCVLVFDITNPSSFNELSYWLNEFRLLAHENAFILLIGNKKDLEDKRQISPQTAEEYAQEKSLIYLETSAYDGTNIKETFERLAQGIIDLVQNKKIVITAPIHQKEIQKENKDGVCC